MSPEKLQTGQMCPICQTSILEGDLLKTCEGCHTDFHEECWNENGGCATYGCEYAPETTKDELPEQEYWGTETKTCPMCAETIPVSALRCPYCSESFEKPPKSVAGRRGAILVFICGLLGCAAPFNLLFGGIWYKKNRERLSKASPLLNLLAIIGLSVSALYTLLILLIFAFH